MNSTWSHPSVHQLASTIRQIWAAKGTGSVAPYTLATIDATELQLQTAARNVHNYLSNCPQQHTPHSCYVGQNHQRSSFSRFSNSQQSQPSQKLQNFADLKEVSVIMWQLTAVSIAPPVLSTAVLLQISLKFQTAHSRPSVYNAESSSH